MNLKKMWKRFWTMNVHNHEGFTLVELIIVIAILAILSSVAVVGYSSYVKKANKQADQTLIAEIKNALTLAYYADTFDVGETACIILSVGSDAKISGTNMNEALTNAFGENYASVLQLKYNGWKGGAGSVYVDFTNSGFNGNVDQLMGDIQDLTDAVGTFLEYQDSEFMTFVGGSDWVAFQEKYNIDTDNDAQVANATALFVAQKTMKNIDKQAFIDAWCTKKSDGSHGFDLASANFDPLNMGILANMAAHYARAEALAAFIDANAATKGYTLNMGNKTDGTTPYTSMKEWFADKGNVNGTNPTEVTTDMERVTREFAAAMGDSRNAILRDYLTSEQAKADATAYLSMMGAINDHSDQLIEGINEGKMYDGGMASDLLNSYLAAGEAMSNNSVPDGSVAVVITVAADGFTVMVVGASE